MAGPRRAGAAATIAIATARDPIVEIVRLSWYSQMPVLFELLRGESVV